MSRPRISRQGEPCAAPNKVLGCQHLACERRGQVVRYSTNTRTIHSFGCPVYAWPWALTARASHTHSSRPRVSSQGDYCAFDALATSFVAYLASINLMRKEDDFSETGTCGRGDSSRKSTGSASSFEENRLDPRRSLRRTEPITDYRCAGAGSRRRCCCRSTVCRVNCGRTDHSSHDSEGTTPSRQ